MNHRDVAEAEPDLAQHQVELSHPAEPFVIERRDARPLCDKALAPAAESFRLAQDVGDDQAGGLIS
jgi:hypothetical protein